MTKTAPQPAYYQRKQDGLVVGPLTVEQMSKGVAGFDEDEWEELPPAQPIAWEPEKPKKGDEVPAPEPEPVFPSPPVAIVEGPAAGSGDQPAADGSVEQ